MVSITSAFDELGPNHRPQAFGRDHDYVDIIRRPDGSIMNGEAVGKKKRLPAAEVGRDIRLVDIGHLRVGQGEKDDVRLAHRPTRRGQTKSVPARRHARPASRKETDDDRDAAVAQV